MQVFICITIAVLMTGCASPSIKVFQAPDGSLLKTAKCTSDPVKCFVVASQSCDSGTYRVIASESHAGGTAADILPGPITWYSMTFACGPSDGKMPEFKWVGPLYTPTQSTPMPSVVRTAPLTTNCNKVGESVTCRTY